MSKTKVEKNVGSRIQSDPAFSPIASFGGFSRMKYTPVDAVPPKPRDIAPEKGNSKITTTKPEKQDKESDTQPVSDFKDCSNGTEAGSNSVSPSSTVATDGDSGSAQHGCPDRAKTDKLEDPQGDLADVEDLEEQDFVWEDYLKETGATSVPPTAFKHVEHSLQSGFSKGMKLEAPNKHSPNTYWIANIVMTCGPLLRLRYEGYGDNSSADFWSDPMTSDIHPLGWCEENGKAFQPPKVIEEKYPDWKAFLTKRLLTATKAPPQLLDKSTGATPVDQIQEGMRLEVQESVRRDRVWVVRVVENVGGRLFLHYQGLDMPTHDFWLFYLHERLHPLGWSKAKGYSYRAPKAVIESSGLSEEKLLKSLQEVLEEVGDQKPQLSIFQDQPEIQTHMFQQGMKLEALNPADQHSLGPATVIEVIDNHYFVMEMDTLVQPTGSADSPRLGCHRHTPTIFPVGWAAKQGIKLRPPPGWDKGRFIWEEYLEMTKAEAAPNDCFDLPACDHEFECGMKLEAVNPVQCGQIGAATITQRVAHLVWVHLDGSTRGPLDSHAASARSLDLFPIGWCGSNGYQLQPPAKLKPRLLTCVDAGTVIQDQSRPRAVAVVQPEMADSTKSNQSSNGRGQDLYGGPQIYINHRCFSGPYLSKGRIAELPRSVGPGPLMLVMKEVLGMLINTAYKSSRVLRELQLEGRPSPGMVQQTLKAKYKGKSYRAIVEICSTVEQLDDFCRQVCLKLQCCPNLISPRLIAGDCPERCDQLTKTKYTYYYGKKRRKIGRPPGGHSNLEEGQARPGGRRRKRKKIGMLPKRSSHALVDNQEEENADDDKESVCSDTRTVDSSSSTAGSKDQQKSEKQQLEKKKASGKPLLEKRGKLARERANLALKRRYTHHIPPPSGIQTRGAKLPKYSFEKRTHKKIMIMEGGSQQGQKPKKEAIKILHGLLSSNAVDVGRDRSNPSSAGSSLASAPIRQNSLPTNLSPSPLPLGGLKQEPPLLLDSNPLDWTVGQVTDFLATTDCGDGDMLARLKTEEIDGQALLLLTLPSIQEFLGVKLGPAIKLCHVIERLKLAFFHQFAG